ncbi:MAG: DUF1116 domain-containing protein [Candidatus Nanopelagicales bacterium]
MSEALRELPRTASVVNLGLPLFTESVQSQGAEAVQVDWSIPAEGDPDDVAVLTTLYGMRSVAIDEANREVLRRLDSGSPMLTGVVPARSVVPALGEGRLLLHAGPPIEYDDVCDPLRRSMRAATVAEGWAADAAEAERLLASGAVRIGSANDHGVVVPMATALGPSMPVWVADNASAGTVGYSPVSQGPGDVAWFGRDSQAAIDRLVFLRDVAQPRFASVLESTGPVDIMALATQGVQMGDDVHMRTQASTNLLIRDMLPGLTALAGDAGTVELGQYLSKNHLFFLTIAMAGAKALTRSAEQVTGSTIITTMARNGTTYGAKVAGSQDWIIADAPPVADALYYSGFSAGDAAPDIGDSAVLELVGLGGAAAAGSPAVAAFLGGSMADAARATEEMRQICAGSSSRFKLPIQDYRGTPLGVDVRKVVRTRLRPKVTTGILHASSGHGQIGAGVATAPLEVFREVAARIAGQ